MNLGPSYWRLSLHKPELQKAVDVQMNSQVMKQKETMKCEIQLFPLYRVRLSCIRLHSQGAARVS